MIPRLSGPPAPDKKQGILWIKLGTTRLFCTTPNGETFEIGGGGGGTSDHAALSHLAWIDAAHTGAANRLAGWGGSGAAALVSAGSGLALSGGSLTVDTAIIATQSWVTSQGYLTSSSLSGYATQSWVSSGYATITHATQHKHGGSDEIATATPAANAIPKADSGGKLDGWLSDASTTSKGKVQLAPDGDTSSGKAVQGNDARLSNARTPSSHATSHKHGGSDEIGTSTPTANAIPKADSSGLLDSWVSAGGLGGSTALNAARRFWGQIRADGGAIVGIGVTAFSSSVTNITTNNFPEGNIGVSGSGNVGIVRTTTKAYKLVQAATHYWCFKCESSVSNHRVWVGLADAIGNVQKPAGALVGLVYDPAVSSNWQTVSYDGSAAAATYTDTGKAYTASELVEVQVSTTSTSVTAQIRTFGGTTWYSATNSTNMPSSTLAMWHFIQMVRTAAGTSNIYYRGSSFEGNYA